MVDGNNKYKIYIENKFGYQLKGIFNFNKTMNILDNHIIEQRNKNKVLVIEIEDNCEFPFYVYSGDYIDYMTFRADFYFDTPKKRVK